MSELKNLFSPFKLGNIELKNKVVMTACQTNFTKGHHITEQLKNFYEARARGGVGMIVIGFIFMVRSPQEEDMLCLDNDDLIPEYRSLIELIHKNGTKIMAQLGMEHLWRRSPDAPLEAVGPSNVAITRHFPVVRPLSVEEIHQIEDEMVEAIIRAKKANFDGVEIHSGQGLLLSQFLSLHTNKRTDEYSTGSLENRTRFLSEIIAKARKKVGSEFTLTCKISGDDFIEGGNSLEETVKFAPMLEQVGIQGITVAAGWHSSPVPLTVSMVPEGGFTYLSEKIKKVVNIPVITGYRITSPQVAEDILAKEKADLIGLARAVIADPEWPNKAKEGRFDDIRPCIVCCRCLDRSFSERKGIFCSINPKVGREGETYAETTPKKVFIVGSGPAGMESALTAVKRGHSVWIVECSNNPGGQLKLAAAPPYKADISKMMTFYQSQLKNNDIKISLNTEVTPDLISRERPDVIIIATGSSPIIPDFPGVQGEKVMSTPDILSGKKETGDSVVIVGGGMIGCETAELLASRGKKVTVLEMLDRMANDVGPSNRWVLLMRLKKAGVRTETKARVLEIKGREVIVSRDGKLESFSGDSIVIAVGMKSSKGLAGQFQGSAASIHVIGDASSPRRIKEAIEEGYLTGMRI